MKLRRRGYTLVECLVALALFASVLGTVVVTLHVLYGAERGQRAVWEQNLAIDQFSARLRADAHRAEAAAVKDSTEKPAGQTELSLTLPGDETVLYTLAADQIERIVRRGDAVRHRESFCLVAASSGWELHQDRPSPLVALELRVSGGSRWSPSVNQDNCRIVTAVGLGRPRTAGSKS